MLWERFRRNGKRNNKSETVELEPADYYSKNVITGNCVWNYWLPSSRIDIMSKFAQIHSINCTFHLYVFIHLALSFLYWYFSVFWGIWSHTTSIKVEDFIFRAFVSLVLFCFSNHNLFCFSFPKYMHVGLLENE